MGKIIYCQKLLDKNNIRVLKELVDELEKQSEFTEWPNQEKLEEFCRQNPKLTENLLVDGEFMFDCALCETAFESNEKIISKELKELNEFILFHENCFISYKENYNKDPSFEEIDSIELPNNVCSFCGETYDHDLSYTDGKDFYCDECAEMILARTKL